MPDPIEPAADTTPDTTADTATQEPQEAEKPRLRDQDLATQLEVTRDLSRKHEKQAKENYRQLEEARAELAEQRRINAIWQLRADHPQFTEEDIVGCHETDPDAIKAWGDNLQAIIDRHAPAAAKDASKPKFSTPELARAVDGANAQSVPAQLGDSPETIRKRMHDKYSARR